MKKILLSSVIIGILTLTHAQENELKTHAELGFISTSGNTDTTAYNLGLEMKKAWEKHHLNFSADVEYADDSGVETNNKFLTELQYNYDITPKIAFDYLLGYKEDKFSGYSYQAYTGPGAKYKAIEETKHKLVLEGHVLYSKDELDSPKLRDDYTSLRAKGVYNWQILENLKFTQSLSYRVEVEETDNYFVYSKSAFVSKISGIFSFGIAYKIDYVNATPPSTVHTDKTLTASLIIDY